MNLNYRILDCDIFESYMMLEGWDNFPLLKSYARNGEFSYILQGCSYMVFDYTPSTDFLKAVCVYQLIGDTLSIKLFEVNKNFRGLGIGTYAMERLMIETGAKKVFLDAKNANAEVFWKSLGMEQIDNQTFCFM
ncbi:MAG: GNAT family N-acetyltransferase [Treponema sp.]|jgi:ribosomal protein S18 acetylase RimI-like enzyme|nr:GNAT family N-acetyltransferase [Treponema sp.]